MRTERDRLSVGIVSRLAWQKGLDLLADAVPALTSTPGAQLAVLGTGEAPTSQQRFAALAAGPIPAASAS